MSRPPTISLRLDLLDQQVLDVTGRPVGRIDDLELELDGSPGVLAFRTGGAALGDRLGGAVGGLVARACRRLADGEASPALPIASLVDRTPRLRLGVGLADLPGTAGLERWLGRRVVSRVPGGGDARD